MPRIESELDARRAAQAFNVHLAGDGRLAVPCFVDGAWELIVMDQPPILAAAACPDVCALALALANAHDALSALDGVQIGERCG